MVPLGLSFSGYPFSIFFFGTNNIRPVCLFVFGVHPLLFLQLKEFTGKEIVYCCGQQILEKHTERPFCLAA